ncbi:TRAP transporter small permease subunit [Tepidamorphus sp. 3E244]|uniref:TRAP transporter small permease subunit n=1 Tax=Tepidamorphus sp. 3E244 TaxID=3385498 RepID=UPI0038FC74CB
MANILAVAGLVLTVASLLVAHPLANILLGVALLCILAAGVLRARGALVIIALVAVAATFLTSSDGFGQFLKDYAGVNPRGFWRGNSELVALAAAFIIIALYMVFARMGAEGWPRYVVDTTRDLDRIVVGVGRVAAWLFVPMMIIIFYDISQRKIIEWDNDFVTSVFFLDSNKLQELEWHLHATLFLLCLGYAYVKDAHVRIELVRDRMSNNARVWMELLGVCLFLLTYSFLIVKFGYTFAERSWKISEVSSAQTGLTHRWIIKGMMPIGFTFLFMAGLSAAFKCMVYLFGPKELRPEVDEYAMTHHADLRPIEEEIQPDGSTP